MAGRIVVPVVSSPLAGFAVQRFNHLIFKEVHKRKTITKKAAELSV